MGAVSAKQWKLQSCQTSLRNFVRMISTVLMKQVYFILLHRMVSQATNTTLIWLKESKGLCNCVMLVKRVVN